MEVIDDQEHLLIKRCKLNEIDLDLPSFVIAKVVNMSRQSRHLRDLRT